MVNKSTEIEEPISFVVEHFRPKPIFSVSQRVAIENSVHSRRKRSRRRGFSHLSYHRGQEHASIHFVYLFPTVVVQLKVKADEPYGVSLLGTVPSRGIADLQRRLEEVCILQNERIKTIHQQQKSCSLFLVVSNLLGALEDLEESYRPPPVALLNKDRERRTRYDELRKPLLSKAREVALATLLLRYSSIGTKRDVLCRPLPSFPMGHTPSIVERIYSIPNIEFASSLSPSNSDDASHWWAFFQSLPWLLHGTLSSVKKYKVLEEVLSSEQAVRSPRVGDGGGKLNSPETTSNNNFLSFRLVLDLCGSVRYETPRFARLARRRGGVKRAYHGTQLAHLWSILQYGLQPVTSDTVHLKQSNGALYGEGIYVSPVFEFAKGFARKNASAASGQTKALQRALNHPALLQVLELDPEFPIKDYAITILPILEVTVIPPPESDSNATSQIASAFSSSKSCPSNVMVIPNPLDVQLDQVILIVELQRKPKQRPVWLNLVAILAVLIAIWCYRHQRHQIDYAWSSYMTR